MRQLGLAGAVVMCAGCAYVGDPLPPALHIPEKVTDLRAVQRGPKVYVDFTPPLLTTDGVAAERLSPPDLRAGDVAVSKIFDAAPFLGQTIEVHVRYTGRSGRISDWSNPAQLTIVSPLEAPTQLRAEMTPKGAKLEWSSTARQFRVYRDGQMVATSPTASFLDPGGEFGKSYKYEVQAVQPTGTNEAESELSPAVTLDAADTFPPAPPTRLVALAGVSSVELSWERSPEPDISTYRVYRDDRLVATDLTAPNFSDSQVQHGGRYRYAVTAVDRTANESPRTSTVEIVFP